MTHLINPSTLQGKCKCNNSSSNNRCSSRCLDNNNNNFNNSNNSNRTAMVTRSISRRTNLKSCRLVSLIKQCLCKVLPDNTILR